MGAEDALEEDDDDVDFNPYLQLSPSLDGPSGDSSEEEGEVDEAEDDVEPEVQEEGVNIEGSHSLEKEIEEEKDLDEEDFVELGSDDYVEEDIEDEEQDELVQCGTSSREDHSTRNVSSEKDGKRPLRRRVAGEDESNNEGGDSSDGDAGSPKQDSEGDENPLLGENLGSGKISGGFKDETWAESPGRSIESLSELRNFRRGGQTGEILGGDSSEDIGDDAIEAISKRTRAHYSLADMSLDQLEMFLQESDEEEYFQNVDDEEEYRKFLLAVQEQQDGGHEESEHQDRKEDEDDEDEDADFEFEIEEALESDYDDASGFTRKRKRRRPETRENRRQRAKAQSRGTHLSQSKAPLRPLLPHTSNLSYASSDKRKITDGVEQVWAPNVKKKVPVNGFTAHQIGQLYCLIHEHVQLLVQVHAMCALEPSRQQITNDTHRMLMELADKRDVLLSWKKTAFPDFCFKPPYTHPSFTEDEEETTTHRFQFPGDTALANQATCRRENTGVSVTAPLGSAVGSDRDLVSWKSVKSGSLSSAGPSIQLDSLPRANLGSLASLTCTVPKSADSTGFLRDHSLNMTHLWHQPFRASQTLEAGQTKLAAADGTHGSAQFRQSPFVHGGAYPGECSFSAQASARTFPPVASTFFPNLSTIATSSRPPHPFGVYGDGGVKQAISEWAPATNGPVRTLLDVAPLALVREFLDDMSRVAEEYRQRHVESGAYHSQCEREPLFTLHEGCFRRNSKPRTLSLSGECMPVSVPRFQIKKTMAAALVESTKKESLALVPRDVAKAVERFLPMFNPALFPHKPPPLAAANRLLFTDAEDELLAMGLMMYNTDWTAIQQRFLPSKTMHQIFVRQKNRSSARAPENPVKAVRRMKSSPLTAVEKARIQEGLKIYKYDWHKVWEACVPHRDPAVLPRQWRIALGTQKSYKTSESSKERRRLYEANRRQAKKAMEYRTDTQKDTAQSSVATTVECRDVVSGEEEDYGEGAYIRDAFLADWCPSKSPAAVASVPPSGGLSGERPKTKSSVPKKKKVSAGQAPEARPVFSVHSVNLAPSPSTWANRQALLFGAKQTVKLAPGLPSVKLPPHVQVLSQTLVPALPPLSSSAVAGESVMCRLPQLTAQNWSRATGPVTDRLVSINPPQYFSSAFLPTNGGRAGLKSSVLEHRSNPESTFLPVEPFCINPSQSMLRLNELPTAKGTAKSTLTTTSVDLQKLAKDLDKRFGITQPSPSAVADQVQNSVRKSTDGVGTNALPSGEVQPVRAPKIAPSGSGFTCAKPKRLPSRRKKGGVLLAASSSSGMQHIPSHLDSVFSGTPQESFILQTCIPAVTSSSHQPALGSDGQISDCPSTVRVNPERVAPPGLLSHEPGTASEPLTGGDAAHQSIAGSLPESTYRATGKKGQKVSNTGPLIKKRSAKRKGKSVNLKQPAIRATQDFDEQGAGSVLHGSAGGQIRDFHTREDDHPSLVHEALIVGEYMSSKQKTPETVETRDEYTFSEPQVIVMEQEELSDSEDEAGIGVEFEHEEMGDSDKDIELELGTCNGIKDISIHFEEEEIGSDREKEEDSLIGRDRCAEDDHGRLRASSLAIAGAMTEVPLDCTYGKVNEKVALDPKGKPARTPAKSKAQSKSKGSELSGGSGHQVNARRDRARKKTQAHEELETVVAAAEVLAVIRQDPTS